MKNILLALALVSASSHALAQSAFTGTYTFTGTTGTNNPFAYNGTDIANLTESALSRSNLSVSSSSGNFRSSGFALDLVTNSLTGSYDATKFFQFSLTADSGFTLSMSNITFGLGRSGTGPRSWAWASSVDNFAAFTGNYSSLGASGYFSTNVSATNPAGALYFLTDQSGTAGTNVVLDLSGASFQNLTSITFRLYGWNSESTAGTAGLQGPMSFSGSLLNTNPVSGGTYWSAVAGGGGSGTWTSAGTTWATNTGGAGAGQAQSSSTLIFADTAGTVTVSGGVTASNGMTFQTTGYNVQSGSITLAGTTPANNALTADAGITATISSELAGTTGMTKAGAGTLILSGSNSFTGNAVISGGTLQITNDSVLGNTANDLLNNATLKTTASVALDAGRDVSGNGTFDIANGTTLTVNGGISNTATTLANTGTLSVQGAARNLGSITLNAAGTINAGGTINATGLTAPGVSNGTATINPDIVFSSGTKTINVASGGNLELNGALSGASFLAKTGSGTLTINGANTVQTRIGAAGASPTAGGTVILGSAASGGSGQIQLNSGTLTGASTLVLTNGLSIGGQTNGAALLAGSNLEFQGQSTVFKGSGTTGPVVLNVSNTTTFSGGFGAASGAGTGTGITIGGSGEVVISGVSSALLETITLTDSVKLTLNNSIGGGLNVGANNVLGGNGTVLGSLSFAAGAKFVFNLTQPLIVNGPAVTFDDFGIEDLVGFDNTVANGTYKIIDGLATINTNNLSNLGAVNAFDLGGGKYAYFTIGSLEVNVVPEPSTYALLTLSALGLAGHLVRRRRQAIGHALKKTSA